MGKRYNKIKTQHTSPKPKVAGFKRKVKKKPLTWSDILVLIFCLIFFVMMVLFIYEHVMLFFD
jgi:hypothetical protein